jgi:hypothetical protein
VGIMARRRQRKKKRSEAKQAADRYRTRLIQRVIDDGLENADKKQKQKEYLEEIAKLEQGLLARTVLVKKVKAAADSRNLRNLIAFLSEKFGPVEYSVLHYFRIRKKRRGVKNFPAVRVRFRHVSDAEKIFGGTPLHEVKVNNMKPTSIRAPGIGYGPRGTVPSLEFQPSNRFAELLEKEQSVEKLEVPLVNFSIGHWFPVDQDGFDFDFDGRAENEFVEATATSLSSSVVFDLNNRAVSVNVLDAYGDHYRLTWRFKEINGVIDFFADKNDTYSFVVRLKHPPKIHSISVNAYGEETTTREVEIRNTVGREVFERCLGFKMSCARVQAALNIFGNSSAVQKLTQFGILGQVDMQPGKIKVVNELYARGDFIMKLSQIESTDVCKYHMCKRFESEKYSKWP